MRVLILLLKWYFAIFSYFSLRLANLGLILILRLGNGRGRGTVRRAVRSADYTWGPCDGWQTGGPLGRRLTEACEWAGVLGMVEAYGWTKLNIR